MEQIRALKVVLVVTIVTSTVWVLGWERSLASQAENTVMMPAPTKQEINEARQRRLDSLAADRARTHHTASARLSDD